MNRYQVECETCVNYETDECENCSIKIHEQGCSCHNQPPCSYCTDLKYEEREKLN